MARNKDILVKNESVRNKRGICIDYKKKIHSYSEELVLT